MFDYQRVFVMLSLYLAHENTRFTLRNVGGDGAVESLAKMQRGSNEYYDRLWLPANWTSLILVGGDWNIFDRKIFYFNGDLPSM